MQYYNRKLEIEIDRFLELPQIIAIVGPRRCGKTTLMKNYLQKFPDSIYLSFDDQKALNLFVNEIELFGEIYFSKYKYIFIDEFQYAKEGGKNLKFLYDKNPGKKIFISGSSSIDLTVQAVKYLVGRIIVMNLTPFSFDEFILVKNSGTHNFYLEMKEKLSENKSVKISEPLAGVFNSLLEEYLLYGGYPEVVIQDDVKIKRTLLTNIYSVYFLREVRDLLGLTVDFTMKKLIKALSLQIGNIVLFNELSILSEVNNATLKKYLNFFEKTFISFFVLPFFSNKRVELVKNPKAYFYDLGMRNIVVDNFTRIQDRTDKGAMRENFAAIHLMQNEKINYWRTKSGAEIDFVSERDGKLSCVEVKSVKRDSTVSKSVHSFIAKYKPAKLIIYTDDYYDSISINGTHVKFIPLFLI